MNEVVCSLFSLSKLLSWVSDSGRINDGVLETIITISLRELLSDTVLERMQETGYVLK